MLVIGRTVMSSRFLIAAALGLGLVGVIACTPAVDRNQEASAGQNTPAEQAKAPDLPEAVSGIIERTNAFRKEEGKQPVQSDDQLTKTAEYFADFMASTDKYGHEADGKQPADRVKEHGYDYCIVAENIAYVFNTAGFSTDELTTQFVKGWKESPEHRKNMLDPDVTETGVAVARSESSGKYYAVQLFGRPMAAAIEFSIANESGEKVHYEIEGKTFDLEPRVIRKHMLCRPEELKPQWPEAKPVQPEVGDKLTVVKEGDTFLVRKK
jgi:uncharacterized protein YkwD